MRMNYVSRGARCFNKLDGKIYIINTIHEDGTALLVPLTDPTEPEPAPEEAIVLTEANAICFRYLYNDTIPEKPEGIWEVRDGLLLHDGATACEQGSWKFKAVLGLIPGAVVLLAETSGEHDAVVVYKPDRDQFVTCAYVNSGITAVTNTEERLILAWSETKDKEVETEDGKSELKTYFVGAGLASVGRKDAQVNKLDFPFDPKDIQILNAGKDTFLTVVTDKAVDDDGQVVALEDICGIKYRYDVFNANDVSTDAEIGSWDSATTATVKVDPVTAKVFLVGEDFVEAEGILFQHPLVKEILAEKDWTHIVDLSFGGGEVILTLATDEYDVVRISRKETTDRGVIYSRVQ